MALQDYLMLDPKVTKIDGSRLLEEMNEKMSSMLAKKVKSVSDLVGLAERFFSEYQYDNEIKMKYYNSKLLNLSEFELRVGERFKNIAINLQHSTIHVPTNVYNESAVILNGVSWTDQLNTAFVNNFRIDPTATWQYFCSSSGFLRFYPGTKWETLNIDTFDCRVRDWYLQAAAYPKDLIILLDVSGSMRGLRNQIAKATVHKILDTLNDDDFFNIIKPYSKT
ncbi:hypothetical protein HELRODRAFT_170571 [Helobdella robusta]|uniref:VWA N-terminal domain-containing protein n=1 Tax=Helobdella robusta TaxID=6412 RepID=T1F369_HELRO|nr:hypothetical protein HELRODRAFT_170571 [Helobdella robusta]ESO07247.1 hypothetical protein HELRODRAFT_170571 [Helobdella robusta]